MAVEGGLTSEAIDRILETFKIDSLKELQHRGLEALIKGQYVFSRLPELSRTMAYRTRNTVNRLTRKQRHLNHVV